MLLRKCDWSSLVNDFVKSYRSHMVIVITLVFVSKGYRFSVLKSTMIWPIVQETVLNFVGSPYSMGWPHCGNLRAGITACVSMSYIPVKPFLAWMCLPFCSSLFIVPCQGRLNVSSSSNDVYWLINPQPSFHFYLSLCKNIYLEQSRIQRRHGNTTFQLSSNRYHCKFLDYFNSFTFFHLWFLAPLHNLML